MKLLIVAVFCLLSSAQAQVSWVASSGGRVPNNAILAGTEQNSQVFVCRSTVSSNLIAGKVVVGFPLCYLAFNGGEARANTYDVAVGNGVWRRSNASTAIPATAVLVGFTSNRQNTFACRATHQTYLIAGRLDSQSRNCFVPSQGREFRYTTYDVLSNP